MELQDAGGTNVVLLIFIWPISEEYYFKYSYTDIYIYIYDICDPVSTF